MENTSTSNALVPTTLPNGNPIMQIYFDCRDEFVKQNVVSIMYEKEVDEFCAKLTAKLKTEVPMGGYKIRKDLLKRDHSKISPEFKGEFDIIERRFERMLFTCGSTQILSDDIEDLMEDLRVDLIFHVVENKQNHLSRMHDMFDYMDDEIDMNSKKDLSKLSKWMKERSALYAQQDVELVRKQLD